MITLFLVNCTEKNKFNGNCRGRKNKNPLGRCYARLIHSDILNTSIPLIVMFWLRPNVKDPLSFSILRGNLPGHFRVSNSMRTPSVLLTSALPRYYHPLINRPGKPLPRQTRHLLRRSRDGQGNSSFSLACPKDPNPPSLPFSFKEDFRDQETQFLPRRDPRRESLPKVFRGRTGRRG